MAARKNAPLKDLMREIENLLEEGNEIGSSSDIDMESVFGTKIYPELCAIQASSTRLARQAIKLQNRYNNEGNSSSVEIGRAFDGLSKSTEELKERFQKLMTMWNFRKEKLKDEKTERLAGTSRKKK